MKNNFVLIGIFLVSLSGYAQEEPAMERNPARFVQDRDVIEKAKTRNYKGGSEDGELRVQAQLPKPQRKIAPVVEKDNEKETQDHD